MEHYDESQLEEKIHIFLSRKLRKYPELAKGSFHGTYAVVPRTTSIITDFLRGLMKGDTYGAHASSHAR
jgi:hypothetical protein